MKSNTSLLMTVISTLLVCSVILTLFPFAVSADSVKIISASPGDTVSYSGTGTANAQVRLEISAAIGIGTYQSGGKTLYKTSLNGLHVPNGNSMGITVSPVDTLTVSGSFTGVPLGMSMDGSVSNRVGSFSKSVPGGTYNIVVSGIANGSPSSVSMTVSASQPQTIGSDGTYTASISTSGLPSTVYTVKQGSTTVAMVYLGVQAPSTPTPTATPTPTPSPTAVTGTNGTQVTTSPWSASLGNSTQKPTGTATVNTPTPQASPGANVSTATAGTPSASATQPASSIFSNAYIEAIIAILFGTTLGVVVAYLFVVRKH